MSFAICFNLDQYEFLLSGNWLTLLSELTTKYLLDQGNACVCVVVCFKHLYTRFFSCMIYASNLDLILYLFQVS